MILATSFTADYRPADIYIKTLDDHCNVPVVLFAVEHEREGCVTVPKSDFPKKMCQQGLFVTVLPPLPGDPVILFTDADIKLQRPFTDSEIEKLDGLLIKEVAIGINQGPGATLEDEYQALIPVADDNQLEERFPGWRKLPIWNTGAVAARASTWCALFALYLEYHERLERSFLGPARVQWLICYIVGKHLKHIDMPLSIHSHGHFQAPGVEVKAGTAYYNGEPVALAHALT